MFLEIFATTMVPVSTPPIVMEVVISEEMQTIQKQGLSTPEGRVAFLQNELSPFVAKVNELNENIQSLSDEIASLEEGAEGAQETMVQLTTQLTEKMDLMTSLLPVLEKVMMVESDFSELDAILAKTSPLDSSEEAVLKRVASLCNDVKSSTL